MLISRRTLAAAIPTLATLPAMAAPNALPFIVVGDWGRGGHDDQRAVAVQMAQTAAQMNARFIVSVGDNFYENGVSSVDDSQWQSSFEAIYDAPSLQVPWKIIIGNHDYRGNVQAQLDYARHQPRWQFPARYYTDAQTLPGGATAEFFYVDTSPFIRKYENSRVDIRGQDTDAQLAWLDAALGRSTARWKIVIGHHPIYTPLGAFDAQGYDHDQPDLIARLDPVLRRHGIKIYVCGHDHLLQAVTVAGVHYVVTGAGSRTYPPSPLQRPGFASGAHGFMAAWLSAEALHYGLIDKDGNTLYAETITRA
jgi:tartrate-resistant acid phosphatase type 5